MCALVNKVTTNVREWLKTMKRTSHNIWVSQSQVILEPRQISELKRQADELITTRLRKDPKTPSETSLKGSSRLPPSALKGTELVGWTLKLTSNIHTVAFFLYLPIFLIRTRFRLCLPSGPSSSSESLQNKLFPLELLKTSVIIEKKEEKHDKCGTISGNHCDQQTTRHDPYSILKRTGWLA